MTRTEFYLKNLIKVFADNNVTMSYGMLEDVGFQDILDYIPDIAERDKIELFNNAVDMLEGKAMLKLLASDDAAQIAKVDVEKLQVNFQLFRELASSLFSENAELKDYKINHKAINELSASLKVIQGGRA